MDDSVAELRLGWILETVRRKDKVSIYNPQTQPDLELDQVILSAVFEGSDIDIGGKLRQAMNFDRLDEAKALLADAQAVSDKTYAHVIQENLFAALSNDMPEFVQLYLDHGAKASKLEPAHKPDPILLSPLGPDLSLLNVSAAQAIEALYTRASEDSSGHIRVLVDKYSQLNVCPARPRNVLFMRSIAQHLMKCDVNLERAIDNAIFEETNANAEAAHETAALHMLFVWAVLTNKYELAEKFWLAGDESIPNALFAATLLRRMGQSKVLSKPHLEEARESMLANADKFEALATGVLSDCHASDADKTTLLLTSKSNVFPTMSVMDAAFSGRHLDFMAHPSLQTVVNRLWYGDLKETNSALLILLTLVFPLGIFSIRFHTKTAEERVLQDLEDDGFDNTQTRHRSSPIQKLLSFYASPFVKFIAATVSHLLLCMLFSLYILGEFGDTFSTFEVVLLLWFCSLFIEELHEFCTTPATYFSSTWNRFDTLGLLGYFGGLIIRLSDLDHFRAKTDSKGMFTFVVLVLWLRFLRFYVVSKDVGPKVLMLKRMTKDVITFVLLIGVFLLAYGVAAQAIIWPNRSMDSQTFENVLFRPYFQIYGEMFLEDINEESGCVGDELFSSCGYTYAWLIPPLLALYVLITNIVLINLLIAIFNDTYNHVQEDSVKLWYEQNYELLLECADRPMFPAPFGAFEILGKATARCLTRCCRDSNKVLTIEEDIPELMAFQEWNTDKFLKQFKKEQSEVLENRLETQSEALRRAQHEISELREEMVLNQLSLRRFIAKNELIRGTERMSFGENSLKAAGFTIQSTRSKKQVKNWLPVREYLGTTTKHFRFFLTPDQVPWSVEFPDYEPLDFTDPSVPNAPWSDKDDPKGLQFNCVDAAQVKRTTFVEGELGPVTIQLEAKTGRPLNPYGRTGLRGRGLLGRWGPNHAADTLVTRWRRTERGRILERGGRPVLEFLAIERRDGEGWAIPGSFHYQGESDIATFAQSVIEEALANKLNEHEAAALQELLERGETLCGMYCKDNRNTDNAWIETTCGLFHDDSGQLTEPLRFAPGADAKQVAWLMVHDSLKLFASHRELLKHAARRLDAHFE
eukprot:TRINITY_DN11904_c0_g1_i7.p1 TRINITY_DN11904_c0_g1~~TRINITY_DN11904_c0_g1_i7.p1  ORF type:complete len:1110 (+),score=209.84 TRINITY_DN11904_c0_g1_i7:56-3331(+)